MTLILMVQSRQVISSVAMQAFSREEHTICKVAKSYNIVLVTLQFIDDIHVITLRNIAGTA